MRARSHSPFTLTLDQSQRTARLRVCDDDDEGEQEQGVGTANDDEWEWERLARRHASRTLASYSSRRRDAPLRTLQPPPLSFTERSLPGEHRSPDAVPRRVRPSPFSAEAHKKAIRGLQRRSTSRTGDRFGASAAAAAAAAASSSYAARASSPLQRRSRGRHVYEHHRGVDPSLAAFVPVGEMTSPGRAHLAGSRTPILTSPVRRAPSRVGPGSPPTSLFAASSSFAHLPSTAAAPPSASASLLSRSHPASPTGYRVVAHASRSASRPLSPAPPLGSPKVTWSLEQWKTWAETPDPAAAFAGPVSAAHPAASSAVDPTPLHPSDQLLYPAFLLISPPRVRETAAAKAKVDADEATQAPLAAATSVSHLVGSTADLHAPALLGSVGPAQLPSGFEAIDGTSSPHASAVRSTTSLVACSSPLLASPPPSTVHWIGVQAVRNLHARLLLTHAYESWRQLYLHRSKLQRMLIFVGDQFDRNMVSFHFHSWLRHLSQRVQQRAEEERCRAATAHFQRRRLRLSLQRWAHIGHYAARQQERTDLIWRQRGRDLHSLHLRRCALKQWFVLTRHYYRLRERSEAHHRSRALRSIFFPWLHGANVSQVASLFERRVRLRRQWGAWRAVFLRRANARGLEHAQAARRRGRIFYAWHQLLEHNFLLKQFHYAQWRRLFQIQTSVRSWRHTRVLNAWRALVQQRRDDVARSDALAATFAPAESRRCIQAAWDEWKRQAEVRFEQNFLLVVDGWRRTKLRREAIARWGELVARRRRAFQHAQAVVRFHQRRAQHDAVRQWRRKVVQRQGDRARMQQAVLYNAQGRSLALIRRWRIFKNDSLLLASRTALLRLFQTRPFLRTLRLHTHYQSYKRRMREVAAGYSIRRLGGVLFDQWRGRAEGYRVGKEQQMPSVYWKEPKLFNAGSSNASTSGANFAQTEMSATTAAAASLRAHPSVSFAPPTVKLPPSANLEQVASAVGRATEQEHSFAKFVQSAQVVPLAATAAPLPTTKASHPLVLQESPTRQRAPHAAASLSASASAPKASPIPISSFGSTMPVAAKPSFSQLYPRSSQTSSVLAPPHERRAAARAVEAAGSVVSSPPRAPGSVAAVGSADASSFFHTSAAGQVYPIDHATSVSAFPRSEFVSLPLQSSSSILLEAVQGLPSHGLPRPASEVVPPAWAVSEARHDLARREESELHVPVRFVAPLPSVDFQPVLLPATGPASGPSIHGAAAPSHSPRSSPRSSIAGVPLPAASASGSLASTVPYYAGGATTGPLNLSALSSPVRAAPASSPLLVSGTGLDLAPYPSFYTDASRGSVSVSTEKVDPVEVRKSNRQKLERMLQVSAMPAETFYKQQREQQAKQQREQTQSQEPHFSHPAEPALHASRVRSTALVSDLTAVDDATWEMDEGNYRHEELSRLHYKLNLKRRCIEAWHAQRGMRARCAPVEQTVRTNLALRMWEAWTRAYTNVLKGKLIVARSSFHLQLHHLRRWAGHARTRAEHREESLVLLHEFLQRRLVERCFRSWQIEHWSAVQERKLQEQAAAERKVALLALLADFVPSRNTRIGLRVLHEWHRCMMLVRGERLREQRLQSMCTEFHRVTLGPHLFRPLLAHWRRRLAELVQLKAHLRTMLVDTAFKRTTHYRTFHFLRRLTPVLSRIQQRESLRHVLKQRWRDQVRFAKARQIMRGVSRSFQMRDALWVWGTKVRAAVEQERWEGAVAALQSRVRERLVRPFWQHWSSLSTALVRIKLHQTLLEDMQHSLRSQRMGSLFFKWHASARRQAAERAAKQKAAAKAARKNQMFLSLQVAHLCNKLALLRRSFRYWTLAQARRIEERRRAAEVHVPVVPVFVDSQGVLLHTDVPQSTTPRRETPLPFGVLYQPYVVPTPPPPRPPPPRSPRPLMPAQLGLDPRSPTSLRNLVALPERTPEREKRLDMERRQLDSGASPSASSGAAAGAAHLPPQSVSIEDEPVLSSSRPAGLHLSDLAFISPVKPTRAPTESEAKYPLPHAAAAAATTFQPAASAFPAPSGSGFDMDSGASQLMWHTAPQQPAQEYQQQPQQPQPQQQQSASSSSLAASPIRPHPAASRPLGLSPHTGPSSFGAASMELHNAHRHSPDRERHHVSFALPDEGEVEEGDGAAPHGDVREEFQEDEPQFVGFALPFDDPADTVAAGRGRRPARSPSVRTLVSPPRRHLLRTPVRDARDVFVPLRSVLSSPEDTSPQPRRIAPRSRFAAGPAAAANRERRVLDPRRALTVAGASAGSVSGSDAARSLSSKRFELLNSARNSYAAIHDSQQQQQLLAAAAQRSRLAGSRGSAKGPVHKGGNKQTGSGGVTSARSVPPPADSLLHHAFVQQQEAAIAERAAAAHQRAQTKPDARHGRFGPFRR